MLRHAPLLLPVLLLLLLLQGPSLGGAAEILDGGLPILWGHTAEHISDLPIVGNVVNPNPWHYLQRMNLYRLMIGATDPFMGFMGTGPTENPMWGLALQLGWMLTSGRLSDPTPASTCGLPDGDTMCISTNSWWACENYFVSAMPFLSAAHHSFFGHEVQVQMDIPFGVDEFCINYQDCKTRFSDVMDKWDEYFQGLRAATESLLPDNEKKDGLLGLYWAAQMASTRASSVCNAKQSFYSPEEESFATNYLNSSEYVSASHFHSNLQKSILFLTPLPGRVLMRGDVAPNIPDMTNEENHTLRTFAWMNRMNNLLSGSLVNTWRRSMCSIAMREKGREMLEQVLLNPTYATTSLLTIITSSCPS